MVNFKSYGRKPSWLTLRHKFGICPRYWVKPGKTSIDIVSAKCESGVSLFEPSFLVTLSKVFEGSDCFRFQGSTVNLKAACASEIIQFCTRLHSTTSQKRLSVESLLLKMHYMVSFYSQRLMVLISCRHHHKELIQTRGDNYCRYFMHNLERVKDLTEFDFECIPFAGLKPWPHFTFSLKGCLLNATDICRTMFQQK
jgi:hypothetical protein